MFFPGNRWRGLAAVLVLATIGAALPSFVWAHGDSPLPRAAIKTPTLHAFLLLALLASHWCAFHSSRRRSGLRISRRMANSPLTWAVVGILALYLILLPPHLVHHIGTPQAEAMKCTLFVQGKATDQGTVERVTLVAEPARGGQVLIPFTPPALPRLLPSTCGRSPPDLSA